MTENIEEPSAGLTSEPQDIYSQTRQEISERIYGNKIEIMEKARVNMPIEELNRMYEEMRSTIPEGQQRKDWTETWQGELERYGEDEKKETIRLSEVIRTHLERQLREDRLCYAQELNQNFFSGANFHILGMEIPLPPNQNVTDALNHYRSSRERYIEFLSRYFVHGVASVEESFKKDLKQPDANIATSEGIASGIAGYMAKKIINERETLETVVLHERQENIGFPHKLYQSMRTLYRNPRFKQFRLTAGIGLAGAALLGLPIPAVVATLGAGSLAWSSRIGGIFMTEQVWDNLAKKYGDTKNLTQEELDSIGIGFDSQQIVPEQKLETNPNMPKISQLLTAHLTETTTKGKYTGSVQKEGGMETEQTLKAKYEQAIANAISVSIERPINKFWRENIRKNPNEPSNDVDNIVSYALRSRLSTLGGNYSIFGRQAITNPDASRLGRSGLRDPEYIQQTNSYEDYIDDLMRERREYNRAMAVLKYATGAFIGFKGIPWLSNHIIAPLYKWVSDQADSVAHASSNLIHHQPATPDGTPPAQVITPDTSLHHAGEAISWHYGEGAHFHQVGTWLDANHVSIGSQTFDVNNGLIQHVGVDINGDGIPDPGAFTDINIDTGQGLYNGNIVQAWDKDVNFAQGTDNHFGLVARTGRIMDIGGEANAQVTVGEHGLQASHGIDTSGFDTHGEQFTNPNDVFTKNLEFKHFSVHDGINLGDHSAVANDLAHQYAVTSGSYYNVDPTTMAMSGYHGQGAESALAKHLEDKFSADPTFFQKAVNGELAYGDFKGLDSVVDTSINSVSQSVSPTAQNTPDNAPPSPANPVEPGTTAWDTLKNTFTSPVDKSFHQNILTKIQAMLTPETYQKIVQFDSAHPGNEWYLGNAGADGKFSGLALKAGDEALRIDLPSPLENLQAVTI